MRHVTLTNNLTVEVKIGDEVYRVNPPFIIGREEALGEELDYLAIKTLDGRVLYRFSKIRCKWGCDTNKGEYDCVSHNHVKVEAEGSGIRVSHIGRTKTYIEQPGGQVQELTPNGIFIADRLVLYIPGLKPSMPVELSIVAKQIIPPPPPPPPGDLCQALCEVYDPINDFLESLDREPTDKDLQDLRKTLIEVRGSIKGIWKHFREVNDEENAGIMNELHEMLEHIIELINVAQPDKIDVGKLRGMLKEIQTYAELKIKNLKCECKQ